MTIHARGQLLASRMFNSHVRKKCSATRNGQLALSNIDVLIILGTVAMIAVCVLWLLPYLASTRGRGHSASSRCINNLKQIGLASLMYKDDNAERFPWEVSTNFGGSMEYAGSAEVFRHFRSLSNELVTPKVLHCRTDQSRSQQSDWSLLGNFNVSYFVGLDTSATSQNGLIAGDRQITGGASNNDFLQSIGRSDRVGWAQNIHDGQGCVAFSDGSAQRLTSAGLQSIIKSNTLPVIRLAIP